MRPVVRQDSPPASAPDAPTRPAILRAAAQPSFPTWKEWGFFLIQIVLVSCIEVSDDLLRGLLALGLLLGVAGKKPPGPIVVPTLLLLDRIRSAPAGGLAPIICGPLPTSSRSRSFSRFSVACSKAFLRASRNQYEGSR